MVGVINHHFARFSIFCYCCFCGQYPDLSNKVKCRNTFNASVISEKFYQIHNKDIQFCVNDDITVLSSNAVNWQDLYPLEYLIPTCNICVNHWQSAVHALALCRGLEVLESTVEELILFLDKYIQRCWNNKRASSRAKHWQIIKGWCLGQTCLARSPT